MLSPKMNQTAVAFQWALRVLQAASILEAIGQHRLELLAVHLGAAVPSMIPLTMYVIVDATRYRTALGDNFKKGATDDNVVLVFPESRGGAPISTGYPCKRRRTCQFDLIRNASLVSADRITTVKRLEWPVPSVSRLLRFSELVLSER